MEVIKGKVTHVKGIPPSGLCVGVHRAGLMHQRMVQKHGGKDKVESLDNHWFDDKARVGVIGSNETPDWLVDEVVDRIKSMAA